MEFGPRALGARSILGDPRSPAMQATMNLKIKFRESFRPFAPAVLRERAAEWFDLDPRHESPYMLLVAPVREEHRASRSTPRPCGSCEHDPDLRQRVNVVRSSIPAVTHVDYSARLQTVDAGRNPRFYRLLEAFDRLTGCPVLVNTSFNVRGEPIVCTPAGRLPLLPRHRHGRPGAGGRRGGQGCAQPARPARRLREAYLAQFQLD